MKIYFEDRSYAEISKARSPKKYFVTVGAREDQEIIVNSAEVTIEQLEEMLSDIPIRREAVEKPKPKPKAKATKSSKSKETKKKTTKKKRATKTKPVEKTEQPTSTSTDEKPALKPLDGYA